MIVLHGLKACDTCRKALKALAASGADVRLRDLRSDPVTADEVAAWSAHFGSSLLNTRSTTWRGLDEDTRRQDPVVLMTAHPALIKRPVIQTPAGLHLGWTPETRAALDVGG
ncbi:arsenate reductase family protein [Jannaschia donghaensis]|uniref:Putative reductase n=1 Tax=Jannaschia donghaensis TaxID=420998 RepID=A0A0M6YFK7_9RHOB|nr:ArsC/Spx/MgsR family protein [Jannaschia donghaensis]CTQ48730.1 putative reductase [Jannaschia donghaensis]